MQEALPPIDSSQDWFLVRGVEEGGHTILEFTRNWTTCDDRDRDISVIIVCIVVLYSAVLLRRLLIILNIIIIFVCSLY